MISLEVSRFRPLTRKRLIHRIIYTNKNHNVMNKKNNYEQPSAELIVVRFEGNFCATGDTNESLTDNNMNGGFGEDED